ncbi:MAG: hypothetical protein A2W98_06040 [Bacteroidetes bacterium GWF2_33_38]|nr:MAG: hypothetical protein A2W98_06040 [Bacteroidetes bacterium GWF2_33_38]OFY90041.1 MAG: hypothetical protein A2236_06305 [Bacteroidetes bacterium RIFOXYA2_FULL_33_7]
MRRIYTFIITLLFVNSFAYSQISEGGTPISFMNKQVNSDIETNFVEPLTKQQIENTIAESNEKGTMYIIGKSIPTDFSIESSGDWTILEDGGKLWRLKIESSGAEALSIHYDNFNLPVGSKLFLYNESKTQVIGAFTAYNNSENQYFATELIGGDVTVLEYYQPAFVTEEPQIHIHEIAYVFRDSHIKSIKTKNFGDSGDCEINVNCSEGDNWKKEKTGVVRILVTADGGQGWCTGSLIANVKYDCTPYILTADHCSDNETTDDLTQWIFYFNYEAVGCSNPTSETGLNSQTMTGCMKVANIGNNSVEQSDFFLTLLQQDVPEDYNAYFNGWNRQNSPAVSGVGIHHPSGDIKKISTYTTAPTTSDYNGTGLESHWRINWAVTANGQGVTEQGSSGSPLFDQNHRIIGDLSGGLSDCANLNEADLYGKISYSWETAGSTSTTRLKNWLDPNNTGVLTLDGSYCLHAFFSESETSVIVGRSVDFTDASIGSPDSWAWTFEGGTPATSTSQNPTNIVYNSLGTFDVRLIVTKGSKKDTLLKSDLIVVSPPELHAYFRADRDTVFLNQFVNFIDTSYTDTTITSWNWTFEAGDTTASSLQNPAISWDTLGRFDVKLIVTDPFTADTLTKYSYITVIEDSGAVPNANFAANYTVIFEGDVVNFTGISWNTNDWEWTFDGGVPSYSFEQNPLSIRYDSAGTYRVMLRALNPWGVDSVIKETYILVLDHESLVPPIADFSVSRHLIKVGESVNYTDLSTGGYPTSWEWTLEGGTPSTSIEQHPLNVIYDIPGAHSVTLTVADSAGFDTKSIDEYIFVTSTPIINICDSAISNVLSTEMLKNPAATNSGYISGHNGDNISVFAEYFDYYIYTKVNGLIFPVAKAHATTDNSKVTFKVWSRDSLGLPGAELGSQDIKINTLVETYFQVVEFDEPVDVYGSFFIGYEISYASADTFAVYLAEDRGNEGISTFYVKDGTTWENSADYYSYNTSSAIRPITCVVGIDNREEINDIFVYPNPSNSLVNVDFMGISSKHRDIQVYDVMGRQISINVVKFSDNNYSLDFSNKSVGIYFLKISDSKSTITKKLSIIK